MIEDKKKLAKKLNSIFCMFEWEIVKGEISVLY